MKRKIVIFMLLAGAFTITAKVSNFETKSIPHYPEQSSVVPMGRTPEAYKFLSHSRKTATPKLKCSVKPNHRIAADKVEVTLESNKVFGESSSVGHQMLLDADHSAYGDIIYDWASRFYESSYEDFEYKIPENAECNNSTTNVVNEGAQSIEIPAGVYDFMIVYPEPNQGMFYAHGNYAKVDDFEFKGGCSYRFTVAMEEGDDGIYDYVSLLCDIDAAITALHIPENSATLTDAEEISIDITNRGNAVIPSCKVSYSINDGCIVTETIDKELASGETYRYTFQQKADFSEYGTYTVTASIEFEGDMIPGNDSKTATCRHLEPQSLPYVYDFSERGEEAFEEDWTIVNVDGDYSTWSYYGWKEDIDGNMGIASCSGKWTGDYTDNDYMISLPIRMPAGTNHLQFYTYSIFDDEPEIIEILLGSSPDYTQMTPIGEFTIMSTEWQNKLVNFDVPEDGNYYIAFHAKSVNGTNVYVDYITIDAGAKEADAILEITKVVLPYSNCDLSETSPIGAVIANRGAGDATDFSLSYTVLLDNEKTQEVSENFEVLIQSGASQTVYFNTTADLSVVGDYMIEVSTADGKHGLGEVSNFEPTALPVTTTFANQENIDIWTEMNPGSWEYISYISVFSGGVGGLDNGLISRCFDLSTPVRFKLTYGGSKWYDICKLQILFGKAGTDLSTYQEVYRDDDAASEDIKQVEITVNTPAEDPDSYNFVIVNNSNSNDNASDIYLYEAVISAVFDYDIAVSDVYMPASAYTPKEQIDGNIPYQVLVQNRGSKSMSGVKASLFYGDEKLGESETGIEIAANESAMVDVSGQLPTSSVGDILEGLTISVTGDMKDQYEDDNIYTAENITVTESVRACENAASIQQGTGSWGSLLSLGNIYTLGKEDIITGITIGLSDAEGYEKLSTSNICVSLYSLKEDRSTLDKCLFSQEFTRGEGGDFAIIEIDPMILEPGSYFFEVAQLSNYNMGLGYVSDSSSKCYQNVDGVLSTAEGYRLMIRGIFADAEVYDNDAAPKQFITPKKDKSLFSDNETITVTVKNMGYEAASIPVKLSVNDDEYPTLTIDLEPYASADVSFENVDLSTPGTYTLKAETLLPNDKNVENNIITREIISVEEADPTVMNFEYCDDFDAMGDTFNPRWYTVDRLGQSTDSFSYFSYQHSTEPVGFMAFNPSKTTPAMSEYESMSNFLPHSGERFGAAFAPVSVYSRDGVTTYTADTWLISPQFHLTEVSEIEFFVKTRTLDTFSGALEPYYLMISETTDDFDSFNTIGNLREAQVEWEQVTESLADYANKDVYIAIHYVGTSSENSVLMIDDIKISGVDAFSSASSVKLDSNIRMRYNSSTKTLSVSSPNVIMAVEVYNAQGALINLTTPQKNEWQKTLSSLTNGVYVVRASTESGIAKLKFVAK